MSVSSFLSGPFRYLSRANVTDVATIISDIASEFAAVGGWSDESGVGTGPFNSDEQAGDKSCMRLQLTRVSATQLRINIWDQRAALINNQTSSCIDIDAGGTVIHLFTGPDHLGIHAARATPEFFMLARLDPFPHVKGEVRYSFVATAGPRNDANTLTNNGLKNWFVLPINVYAYSSSAIAAMTVSCNAGGQNPITLSNKQVVYQYALADNNKIMLGTLPHVMLVPATLAFGSTVTIPIDVGVTGDFFVVGLVSADYQRLAVRKA